MKKSIVAALVLFVATSAGTALAGNAEAGKTKAAACGGCHGMDGNSPTSSYPKLAGQNEAYIAKQVKDFKANDKRQNAIMFGMVAALTEEDAADIGAYFQSQTVASTAPFDESKLARGRELYKGGDLQKGIPACQGCHGPTGAGVAGIAYPRVGGQYPEYTLAQLKAFKDGSRSNDPKSLMRSIVAKLSADDMEALANYMASIK
ncbi:MAG TPA: cytochrome c4 [Gammaproteobacteria bacterium]|nr:cytochrome c4 [Gammaproteobacteria bacterium]